jgi:hypothetical protein
VLASAETPWTAILQKGGGTVIMPLSSEGIASELERWAGMTPSQKIAAHIAAGNSFKLWRKDLSNVNVLDQIFLLELAQRNGS